jgi:general nucleoside transport system permease protein
MSDKLPYITIALFIAAAIRVSVPLMLGALGESLTERVGNLNLGVEGMMLMGGAAGFVIAVRTDNLLLAILASMLSSGAGAAIYGFLTITMRTNQVVTGLALTIFGAGFANTLGKSVSGIRTPPRIASVFSKKPLDFDLSAVKDIPVIGALTRFISHSLLQHNVYVYATVTLAIILAIFLYKTQQGLNLRAVGENPYAADAAGIRVGLTKYIYVILGGTLCGLAGLYMPLVHVGSWIDNITAGKGWIVVALVIFVRWDPMKAIIGSVFFGALEVFKFYLDIIPQFRSSILFNPYFLEMYPYMITIFVLILTYASKKGRWLGPSSLGLPYFREDR